jgi:hypothetical protein
MATSQFERDTAVEQLSDTRWRVHVVPGWRIGTVPNGGYMLALAGRVLSQALPHPHPLTVHCLYCAPGEIGPAECEVELLRRGKSTSHATLVMRQGGEVKIHVTASYSRLDQLNGENWSNVKRPEITPYSECTPVGEHGIEFRQRINQCYASGGGVFRREDPDGTGRFNGWLSFTDGAAPDLLSLLLFADGMAPPVFTVFGPLQWVPTLDLSVQLRRAPAPGPIQVRFCTRYMTDGIVEEDGELWDSTGELVALSRQASKVRVIPK